MDPLTVLRDFVIRKRLDDVTESEDGKRIHFGDRYSFPKVSLVDQVLGTVPSCNHLISYNCSTPQICASRDWEPKAGLLREWAHHARASSGLLFSYMQDVGTAYKSQMGKGDFYPLNALVFFMKNAKRASELIKLASEAGVRPVTFVDRKVCSDEASFPLTACLRSHWSYTGDLGHLIYCGHWFDQTCRASLVFVTCSTMVSCTSKTSFLRPGIPCAGFSGLPDGGEGHLRLHPASQR